MSLERAQSVQRLFEDALQVAPARRAEWIARACRGDALLEQDVQALVDAHVEAENSEEIADTELQLPNTAILPDSAAETTFPVVHPGSLLGDFLVQERIGAGGMGIVYRAHQVSLSRDVALKVLAPHISHSKTATERFRREARAVARLDHPNIVSVYTTGEEQGTSYYAMQLIDGIPLSKVIAHLKRRPLRELRSGGAATARGAAPGDAASADIDLASLITARWEGSYFRSVAEMLADAAEALAYAHGHQVIHRDIKPSNLLLSRRYEIHIGDFGLARIAEEPGLTRTGECVGTPYYMSPEQITVGGNEIDPRTDVYALGATLYELLTLRPPFFGGNREEVLSKILQSRPPAPRLLNRNAPRDLEVVCLKALEKEVCDRYQSAAEMAADLGRFAKGEPVMARHRGPVTRCLAWLARHRGAAAFLATVCFLVVLTAFFAGRLYLTSSRLTGERQKRLLESAQIAAMQGDLEQAREHVNEAEQEGAPPDKVRLIRGHLTLLSGDYHLACAELEEALRLMPDNLAAHSLMARAYSLNEQHERSAQVVRRLESMQPKTVEDHLFLGEAQARWDIDLAITTLDSAVQADRANVVARLVRGRVLIARAMESADPRDAEAALQDLRIADELLDPNALILGRQVQAHLTAATAYAAAAVVEKSEEHLSRASAAVQELERFPEGYFSHRWRAFYWDYVGDAKKAEAEWRQMQHLRIAFLVLLLHREGRFDEALRLCDERLLRFKPARFTDFFRGFMLAAISEEPQDIIRAFQSEGEESLDPANATWMNYTIHCLAGEVEGARHACQQLRAAMDRGDATSWEFQVQQYTCGEIVADELLDEAGRSRTRLCVAHFLIGMTLLGEGARAASIRHFEASAAFRSFEQLEDHMSRGLANQLRRHPNWPRWIPPHVSE